MAKDPIAEIKDIIAREFDQTRRISHFLTEEDAKDLKKFVDKFNMAIEESTKEMNKASAEQKKISDQNKILLETAAKSLEPYKTQLIQLLELPTDEARERYDELFQSMEQTTPELKKFAENLAIISAKDKEKLALAAKIAKQETAKLEWDNKVQKIARSHQTKIDNVFDKIGLTFKGSEDDPNPLFMLLDDLRKGRLDTDLFKAYLTMPGKIIKNFFDPLNVLVNIFSTISEKTIGLMVVFDKVTAQFLKATGLTRIWSDTLQESWEQVRYYNISLEQMSESIQSLLHNMRSFNQETEESAIKLSKYNSLVANLGVGAEEAARVMSFFKETLGQSTPETIASMSKLLGISKTTGDTFRDILSSFNGAMSEIAKYGNQAFNVFKQVYGVAKALRIESSQLMQVAQGFDTFESAAQSVGRLNAIMGGPYLNTLQMMNQNEGERVQTLNEMFKASGRVWTSLGKFEQQALASAAGISDMNVAAKIFGGNMSDVAKFTREASIKQEELNKRNQDAATLSEKFQNVLLSLGKIFSPVLDALHSFVNAFSKLADLLGPMGFLAPIIMWFSGSVLVRLTSGLGIVQKLTGGVIGGFKKLFSIFNIGGPAAEGAANGIKKFAENIKLTGTSGAAAAPGIGAANASLTALSSSAPAIVKGILYIGAAIAVVIALFLSLKQIASGVGKLLEGVLGGLGNAAYGLYTMIGDFFEGTGKAFTGLFDSPAEDLLESLKDLGPNAASILTSFGSMWEKVSKLKLSDISSSTVSAMSDLLENFSDFSSSFSSEIMSTFNSMTGFLDSVSKIQPEKVENFKQITSNIIEMESKLKDSKSSADLFNSIFDVLNKLQESSNLQNQKQIIVQVKIGDEAIISKVAKQINKDGNVYSMGA